MFGFGRKKKFISQNAQYLSNLIGVSVSDAERFVNEVTYFDLLYEFNKEKAQLSPSDRQLVAQRVVEIVYEMSLTSPPSLSGMLINKYMPQVLVMAYAAKVGAELLGRENFIGSDAEKEIFKLKFTEFVKCEVQNTSGETVSLVSFMSDPIGSHVAFRALKSLES